MSNNKNNYNDDKSSAVLSEPASEEGGHVCLVPSKRRNAHGAVTGILFLSSPLASMIYDSYLLGAGLRLVVLTSFASTVLQEMKCARAGVCACCQ